MLRKNKGTLIVTSLVILLPMAAGLILWGRLPDRISIHFGVDNQPDNWGSKALVVFVMPCLLLALQWFAVLLTAADPKRRNIPDKVLSLLFCIIPLASLCVGTLTYITALGIEVQVGFYVILMLGVIFLVLGNYLPKCRQNYVFGCRTPWALDDPNNWTYTHRVAGWCMTLAGAVTILTSWTQQPLILLLVLAVAALAPMICSFVYYKKHPKEGPADESHPND